MTILDRILEPVAGDDQKKRLMIAGAASGALVFLSVIFLMIHFHTPRNNANAPQGTLWICAKGHRFTLTTHQIDEYQAKHFGSAMTCPVCGAVAERAVECPHCHETVVPHHDRLCPKCKQPLSH